MIGIVVDSITSDSHNYCMFRELNKLSKTEQCFVFTNTIQALPMQNNFTILQHIEALSHQGTLIATSLLNCQIVANSLTPKKKLFYLWGFDWMKFDSLNAPQLNVMLHNPEIELLARSESHKNLISKLFKEPKAIVYNWRSDELIKAIQ